MLAGKAVPVPAETAADRKSEKLGLKYLLSCYEAILTFLQSYGASLAHVKAEHLMPAEPFVRWATHTRPNKEGLEREHTYKHAQGWNDVMLQASTLSPFST